MPAISRLIVLPLALGLALGGCGKKADDKAAAAAGAEVLPGTISDDMIDLDTSTASPPLAPARTEKKKKAAAPSASEAAAEAPAAGDDPAAGVAAGSADPE
ncbi:hypothetical protein [Novosphingobium sp. ERW19]|uniref:hypothetical protein n=1 Tax=Novosphingobium sp. ERW19 TaxID=2726186 RepID=UPI0014563328|nr:hypothetical protein [Novosphingobium sp. ERW19]NLR39523.1 hypothetical protein [Novosphingobium sp. ERW19]